jgi:hypothetical protein
MNCWRPYELPPASAGGPATQHPALAKNSDSAKAELFFAHLRLKAEAIHKEGFIKSSS